MKRKLHRNKSDEICIKFCNHRQGISKEETANEMQTLDENNELDESRLKRKYKNSKYLQISCTHLLLTYLLHVITILIYFLYLLKLLSNS